MRLRDLVSRRLSQDDRQVVHEALSALERRPPSSKPLPDPSFIWWKAQYLRRVDAEHEAAAPVEISDRVHAAMQSSSPSWRRWRWRNASRTLPGQL